MNRLPFIALVGLLLTPSVAFPHAGALPQSLDVLRFPGDEDALSLETTFGVVVSADSQQWRWICHETIIRDMTAVLPRYTQNRDGVLLAYTNLLSEALADPRESVYRSEDGCDWVAPLGLTDAVVADVAFDPEDGSLAVAALANLKPESDNGLRFSNDGGASWAPALVDDDDRIFRSVLFAPGGNGFVWATAARFSVLQAWVARSSDSGQTWESQPLDFPVNESTQVLMDIAAASADGTSVWVRVDAPNTDHILRSTDGGLNFTEVFSVEDIIHDAALDPSGTLWIITEESGLHRSDDGVTFSPVPDAPRAFGLDADQRGLLVAANIWYEDYSMAVSEDGLSFEPLMSRNYAEIQGPVECPEDSLSTQFCDPAWHMLTNQLGRGGDDDDSAGDDDTGDDDDNTTDEPPGPGPGDDDDDGTEEGCQCAASAVAPTKPSARLLGCLTALFVIAWRRDRALESAIHWTTDTGSNSA
ncbi:MAG TPA: hypothetical protein DIU15_05445 [Deltaproteobacteria bacterium]|nr:hypothetical protein [Deltaproteobacteria bacterium]HCP45463.1 hypothetical protein [Deltaproteobacteria bacterium]